MLLLLFQTDVVPALKETAKTVLNGVLHLLLFQTDVVPPLKETAKTVLSGVLFVAIPD
jgi:hypothetical protein